MFTGNNRNNKLYLEHLLKMFSFGVSTDYKCTCIVEYEKLTQIPAAIQYSLYNVNQ